MFAHYLVEIGTDPVTRWWTGWYDLTHGGHTWTQRKGLNVDELQTRIGEAERRLVLELDVNEAPDRADWRRDRGPLQVTVTAIRSSDAATWAEPGLKFVGRMSRPRIVSGVLRVELETYRGDLDSGDVREWSHETQQELYPGDEGLTYVRSIADQEPQRTVQWPP